MLFTNVKAQLYVFLFVVMFSYLFVLIVFRVRPSLPLAQRDCCVSHNAQYMLSECLPTGEDVTKQVVRTPENSRICLVRAIISPDHVQNPPRRRPQTWKQQLKFMTVTVLCTVLINCDEDISICCSHRVEIVTFPHHSRTRCWHWSDVATKYCLWMWKLNCM